MSRAKSSFSRHLIASAVAAGLGVAVFPLQAQVAATPPSASADRAEKLQDVTVTANKRVENARDVSASISVVGSEQLENRHVTSLIDLAGSLPGVQIETGGTPGQTNLSMRGIPALRVSSVVGTYIDDTPLGSSSSFAAGSRFQLDLLPYDIDRIEVLRGPQGTLYGASAMGGILKYVMKEPDLQTLSGAVGGGASRISGASSAGWDTRATVNVPLIKGELAVTASVSQNDTPGWVDNVVTGQNDVNKVSQKSGRLALRWEPTRAVSVKLSAMHQATNADDTGIILLDPVTQAPMYGSDKTNTVYAQPFSNSVDYYSATLNWDLGRYDFTSATSVSRTSTHYVKDNTAIYGPVLAGYGVMNGRSALFLDLHLDKATQEFRFASKAGGQVEWMVGAFFTNESSANEQLLTAKSANDGTLPGLDPLLKVHLPTSYKEAALFGDLTYKLTDSVDLTGGLRYAHNTQSFAYGISGAGAAQQGLSDNSGGASEGVTTWMLSPRFRLSPDSMVYLRATGGEFRHADQLRGRLEDAAAGKAAVGGRRGV
jgi:outer membrane receptor protein involved in Fe transport